MKRAWHWKRDGEDVVFEVETTGDHGSLFLDGQSMPYQILERSAHGMTLLVGGRRFETYVWRKGRECTVWCDGKTHRLEQSEGAGPAHHVTAGPVGEIRAPMAGKVSRVEVQQGGAVTPHQTLIILESMKMETSIEAPWAGRVVQVLAQPGDVVDMGALLIVIE